MLRAYDMVFVGGGLSALLLLNELRTGSSARIAVVDPSPPWEQPPVHWSYWSRGRTPYDRFAIGAWRQARVGDAPPEPIAPFTLRLVRSDDVFAELLWRLRAVPIEWLRAAARSVRRRDGGVYEVATSAGSVRARVVFDSAREVEPVFPAPHLPRAVLSGIGLRVVADRPVFDAATATLFDPLDERSFAYLLPLSRVEALLESASFGPAPVKADRVPLLRYLRERYPGGRFEVVHAEYGEIPLGFAPSGTTGPRHVLLGAKRGLLKPSAGYGVVRIAEETMRLGHLWREGRPLPPERRGFWGWRLLDAGFLELADRDPRLPLALVRRVMHAVPPSWSLRFIDEEVSIRQLVSIFGQALPVVLRGR